MARTVITLNNPKFLLADTEAGLDAGDAYECQITSATITPQPVYNTVPATGCSGASQSPGTTGFQLDLAWLQDWTQPGGGLSGYAWDHDGEAVWYKLLPTAADETVGATGQAYVAAGAFGGTFGDGSAAAATAAWPCVDKPTLVYPAPVP